MSRVVWLTGVAAVWLSSSTEVHSAQTEIFDIPPWALARNDDAVTVGGLTNSLSRVIGQESGDYWVFCTDNGYIFGQRFDSSDGKVLDMTQLTTGFNDNYRFYAARFPNSDGFVVGYPASTSPVRSYFRIFDADGVPLNDDTLATQDIAFKSNIHDLTVVPVTNHSSGTDNIIVTLFESTTAAIDDQSRIRLFDARDASNLTGEIVLDPAHWRNTVPLSCFMLDTNKFIVTWNENRVSYSNKKVAVYDGEGNIIRGPTVYLDGTLFDTTSVYSKSISLGKDGFWAAMHRSRPLVYVSVFDEFLNECGFRVSNFTEPDLDDPEMFVADMAPDESSVVFGFTYRTWQGYYGSRPHRARAQLYGFDFPKDGSNVCSENDQAYKLGRMFEVDPTPGDSYQAPPDGSAVTDGKFVISSREYGAETEEVRVNVFHLDYSSFSPTKTPTVQPSSETQMPSSVTDTDEAETGSALSVYHSSHWIINLVICVCFSVFDH